MDSFIQNMANRFIEVEALKEFVDAKTYGVILEHVNKTYNQLDSALIPSGKYYNRCVREVYEMEDGPSYLEFMVRKKFWLEKCPEAHEEAKKLVGAIKTPKRKQAPQPPILPKMKKTRSMMDVSNQLEFLE